MGFLYFIIILTVSKYTENADNVSHFNDVFFKKGTLNSFKPALASYLRAFSPNFGFLHIFTA